MTSDPDARRYLLGTLVEEKRDRLEQEYFAREPALDRVAGAEEELIEDYIDGRLTADEHEQFEEYYLASSLHQTRVETIRRLSGRDASPATAPRAGWAWRQPKWLALAAAAVLLLAAGVWLLGERGTRGRDVPLSTTAAPPTTPPVSSQPDRGQAPKQPAPPKPSVFAIELTPLALRSGGETPRLIVPPDTAMVELRLSQDPAVPVGTGITVTVAAVSGDEIWRGAGTRDAEAVRVRLPASKLPADDYIVTLHAREPIRYFLRVLPR